VSTRTRSALTLTALALFLAAGAVAAVLALPNTDAAAVQVPAPVVKAPAEQLDPFLVALIGEGVDFPANADELSLAADRVCEGLTAEVPLVYLADGIADEFGVDDTEARRFVNLAGVIRCHPNV
jgi:hypothetical protein